MSTGPAVSVADAVTPAEAVSVADVPTADVPDEQAANSRPTTRPTGTAVLDVRSAVMSRPPSGTATKGTAYVRPAKKSLTRDPVRDLAGGRAAHQLHAANA